MNSLLFSTFLAAVSGALFAVGGSPVRWWPATIVAFALLAWAAPSSGLRRRFLLGWISGAVLFLFSLWWSRQFSLPGYVLLALFQACFYGSALVMSSGSSSYRQLFTLPAAFTLLEWLRWHIPFGGFPMGGITTGQGDGPLLSSVAITGELGLVWLTAFLGASLPLLAKGTTRQKFLAVGAVTSVAAITWLGSSVPVLPEREAIVAVVQGGGPQALPRDRQDPAGVFERHLQTTASMLNQVQPELIVWPENVISLNQPVSGSAAEERMKALSAAMNATIVAGVVESEGNRFRNAVVAWNGGSPTSRYEKVQRVPFGEYVPGRGLVSRVADLSQVPNDAIVGRGPAVVATGIGPAGVSISYEGLFSRRARAAIAAGGEILLIPTNAASYESANVAKAQVQAARMRAVETGRWVIQASPTGISAIVDEEGTVRSQTRIGPAATLIDTAELSRSITPYVKWGDWPLILLSVAVLLGNQVGRPVRPSKAGSSSSS